MPVQYRDYLRNYSIIYLSSKDFRGNPEKEMRNFFLSTHHYR